MRDILARVASFSSRKLMEAKGDGAQTANAAELPVSAPQGGAMPR